MAKATSKKTTAATAQDPREVLDVVRALLAEGRSEEVLNVVSSS